MFTVILTLPTLSNFTFKDSPGVKMSGFAMFLSNDEKFQFSPIEMLSVAGNGASYALTDLWGSDMTSIASNGLIWAQDVSLKSQAP